MSSSVGKNSTNDQKDRLEFWFNAFIQDNTLGQLSHIEEWITKLTDIALERNSVTIHFNQELPWIPYKDIPCNAILLWDSSTRPNNAEPMVVVKTTGAAVEGQGTNTNSSKPQNLGKNKSGGGWLVAGLVTLSIAGIIIFYPNKH